MEFIIFLLILWLILKIIKGIFSFLFGGSSDKKTSTYNVASADNKPSKLKYKNEVYISFRNKVQKAFESYKKSGQNIMWDSEFDGFTLSENSLPPSNGSELYSVKVLYDDQNLFKLEDPFYILVTYGVLFERRKYDDYKKQAEYLNNNLYNEIKRPGIFYTLDTIKGTNFGVYYCNFVVSNNKNLCEETKKLGEAAVFKQLISEARQAHYEGQELYGAKILADIKKFSL
jgi:hypothetical protein